MIAIKPIKINYPEVEVNAVEISVVTFKTSDTTCKTYYQLLQVNEVNADDENATPTINIIADGNYMLTEDEFEAWGSDNRFIEDIVLNYLKLVRDEEVTV